MKHAADTRHDVTIAYDRVVVHGEHGEVSGNFTAHDVHVIGEAVT